MIEAYANNKPMLDRYLRINGIKHLEIVKDYEDGWIVYECGSIGCGWPIKKFQLKRDAKFYADKLASITGLPVVK